MATSLKLHKLCTVLCKLIGGGLEIVVVSNVLFVDLLFFLENLPNVISSMKFHIGRRSPGLYVRTFLTTQNFQNMDTIHFS